LAWGFAFAFFSFDANVFPLFPSWPIGSFFAIALAAIAASTTFAGLKALTALG
jgi:hypothetical protein